MANADEIHAVVIIGLTGGGAAMADGRGDHGDNATRANHIPFRVDAILKFEGELDAALT